MKNWVLEGLGASRGDLGAMLAPKSNLTLPFSDFDVILGSSWGPTWGPKIYFFVKKQLQEALREAPGAIFGGVKKRA